MKQKQMTLDQVPGMVVSSAKSTTRFEIPQEMIKLMKEGEDIHVRSSFPIRTMLSNMKNINLSIDSLSENPKGPAKSATVEFLEELKNYASSILHNFTVVQFVSKLVPSPKEGTHMSG